MPFLSRRRGSRHDFPAPASFLFRVVSKGKQGGKTRRGMGMLTADKPNSNNKREDLEKDEPAPEEDRVTTRDEAERTHAPRMR